MPTLIAGGDSFTWGSDLELSKDGYSHQTWAYLLSKKLNMDYVCAAKPGGANSSISRRVMREVIQKSISNEQIYVAVMWTFTHRNEIRLRDGTFPFNSHPEYELDADWINFTPYHGVTLQERLEIMNVKSDEVDKINFYKRVQETLEKTGISEAAHYYYKITGDHITSYYQTIKEVIVLQTFLESKKIPYFFCTASHELFGVSKKDELQSKELSKLGLPSAINWNKWYVNNAFYNWSKENNYPLTGTHPNSKAHEEWYKLIEYKVFDCFKK